MYNQTLIANFTQFFLLFGTTMVDAYAKQLLHYWLRTTYMYIYGKKF